MAQNKLMHPRNIYRTPPDFKQLAIDYPEFRMHAIQDLSGKVNINFKDPSSLRALTRTLLKKDFGLDVDIPVDRLIPTVPQRLNYILWLEDLLKEDSRGNTIKRGIDIGTGASCVFPLLGCSKNGWNFIATESDQSSYDCATRNVLNNKLQESVKIIRVSESSSLESVLLQQDDGVFDFCMCNPPFFCDSFDASWESKSRKRNRAAPKGANTASPGETITEGGEVEFVKRIIADSSSLKERVRIYTTMLGKKDSVTTIKEHLKENQIPQFVTTEFQQGKTLRWGVAWTFCTEIKLSKIAIPKNFKPIKPLTFFVPSTLKCTQYSVLAVVNKIVELLKGLEIGYHVYEKKETACKLWMRSNVNTWSHQRRKNREFLRQKIKAECTENNHHEPASSCTSNDSRTRMDIDLEQKTFDVTTNHTTSSSGSKKKPSSIDSNGCDKIEDVEKTQNDEPHCNNSGVQQSRLPGNDTIASSESKRKRSTLDSDFPDREEVYAKTETTCSKSSVKLAKSNCSDVETSTKNNTSSPGAKEQLLLFDSDNCDAGEKFARTVNCDPQCSNSSEQLPKSKVADSKQTWLLFADVNISLAGRCILLELKARKEMNARETLHQIMQYLKNNLV